MQAKKEAEMVQKIIEKVTTMQLMAVTNYEISIDANDRKAQSKRHFTRR